MQPTNPWLSRFAKLLVAATFCLIFLGGMVTSKNAGLSVPDWPTSYGYNMFTFPIERWVGGIFFEHTHRLLATCVGLLTTVLVAWIWRNRWAVQAALAVSMVATGATAVSLPHITALSGPDNALTRGLIIMHVNIWSFAAAFAVMLLTTEKARSRYGKPWLHWLAFGAFLLVCVQGTLGGLRVTQTSIVLAMIHACTGQAFLCLTVVIAAALSPRWNADALPADAAQQRPPAIMGLAWALVGVVFCQLMIGAVVRHLHAGLAIPDFPLAFGRLIPPLTDNRVVIHFAHRVGALVVTLLVVAETTLIFTGAKRNAALTRPAVGLISEVALQILLGAYVIWSGRNPIIASLHVVNGAALLATALLLAVRAARSNIISQPESHGWAGCQEAHA